jgi:tetratricopeptide (TPR) repeat protein
MSRTAVRLLLLTAVAAVVVVPVPAADNLYSVVHIKNTTDDITIYYQFKWGDAANWGEEVTVKPGGWRYQYYTYPTPNANSAPAGGPQISFRTGIGKPRPRQEYKLEHYASPFKDSGGRYYEFVKRTDSGGEDYIDLEGWTKNKEQAMGLLIRGRKEYDRGAADDAVDTLTRSIGLYGSDPVAFNVRGHAWVKRGEFGKAAEDYSAAMRLAPTNPLFVMNRGLARFAAGDMGAALDDFNAALVLDPNHVPTLIAKSNTHVRRKEFESAQASADKAVRLAPTNVDAVNARGLARLKLGNYGRAIEDFTDAAKIAPANKAVYSNRGAAYFLSGNFELAVEDCTKAISIDKNHPRAFWWRSQAYAKLGQDDKARADYDEALRLDPSQERVFETVKAYYAPASELKKTEALVALRAFRPGSTLAVERLRELNSLVPPTEGLMKAVNPIPPAVRELVAAEQIKLRAQEFEMSAALERLLKAALQSPSERDRDQVKFYWLLGPVTSPTARDASRDDLGGLRLIGRLEAADGTEVNVIFPIRWYSPPRADDDAAKPGPLLLWGGDNCRVVAKLYKTGQVKSDYAFLSFSVNQEDGAISIRPGLYVDPRTGVLVNKYITSSALSTSCIDCHAGGSNLKPKHYEEMKARDYPAMDGFQAFLDQAKHFGAKKDDLRSLEALLRRDPGELLPLADLRKANEAFWVERFRDFPAKK